MELTQLEQAVDFTFDELIQELVNVKKRIENMKEGQWMLERRILEVMEERGATVAKAESHDVTITRSVSYDAGILAALREITSPDDLERIYYPAHDEVVRKPEKWNMQQGRRLAKLGHEHAAIIEDAKIYGNPTIKIKARES